VALQVALLLGGKLSQNVWSLEFLERIHESIPTHARSPLPRDSLELDAVS
jgi:hypothetical protein